MHSLGFQDIREGLTLHKVTLRRFGCAQSSRISVDGMNMGPKS